MRLYDFMQSGDGWGREQGRAVYQKLLGFVEANSGVMVFKVSLEKVEHIDISFASETIVELAHRFKGRKGFCFAELTDKDMIENWDAAAARKEIPLMIWNGHRHKCIGLQPSNGNAEALAFAMKKPQSKAAEYASATGMTIANASMKFKQLWEQGFLLRHSDSAESGGVEYVYQRIG
jgi:hypothetical protein